MRVSICGSGMVGYTVGRGLRLFGNDITYLDVDWAKINKLKEEGHESYHITDPEAPLGEFTFICVPTPTDKPSLCINGLKQNLDYVLNACETLCSMATCRRLVIKSTVLPDTIRGHIYPLVTKICNRYDINIYDNPEFLTENNSLYDFLHNKIVIGTNFALYGNKDEGLQKLLELYKPFRAPKIVTTWEESEMIKYASNLALANKVDYWCEIDEVCKKLHIDTSIVAETVGMDKRIGTYGIRPFGQGFRGSCLPKDSRAFHTWLAEHAIIDRDMDMFGPMIKLNDYITGSR